MQRASGTIVRASATSIQQSQFRKSSAPLGPLAFGARVAIGCTIAIAFVAVLRTESGEISSPSHAAARYVTLPLVVIEGKRLHDGADATVAAQRVPQSDSVKFVGTRD